jgi:hypothetical protein
MGKPSLLIALDYLLLLVEERPEKFPPAALRWHGRLKLEATTLTLAESQLALSALIAMRDGNGYASYVPRQLLRNVLWGAQTRFSSLGVPTPPHVESGACPPR